MHAKTAPPPRGLALWKRCRDRDVRPVFRGGCYPANRKVDCCCEQRWFGSTRLRVSCTTTQHVHPPARAAPRPLSRALEPAGVMPHMVLDVEGDELQREQAEGGVYDLQMRGVQEAARPAAQTRRLVVMLRRKARRSSWAPRTCRRAIVVQHPAHKAKQHAERRAQQ
jgi:hypothetical protein